MGENIMTDSVVWSDGDLQWGSGGWSRHSERKRWTTRIIQKSPTLSDWAGTQTAITAPADVAVLPGQVASHAAIVHERARSNLSALIKNFEGIGFSWNNSQVSRVDSTSAAAAQAFIRSLPEDAPLPKLAPDGDGGVLFVWEELPNPLLVVVDNWRLHMVKAANTPDAEYLQELPFDGEKIPEVVIEAIKGR
jgi:hypothetical protein